MKKINENKKIINSQKLYFIISCAIYLAAWIVLPIFYACGFYASAPAILLIMYCILLPILSFIAAFIISLNNVFGRLKWLTLIFFCAMAFAFLDIFYLRVDLNNALGGLFGGIPALMGLAFGHIMYIAGNKRASARNKIIFIVCLAIYLLVWTVFLIIRFFNSSLFDISYMPIYCIFLAIAMIISSFLIGTYNIFKRLKWLTLIFYYATAVAFIYLFYGYINIAILLAALLCSLSAAIGLAAGHIFYIISLKKQSKKEENIKPCKLIVNFL